MWNPSEVKQRACSAVRLKPSGCVSFAKTLSVCLASSGPADTQESDAISSLREQLDMLRTVVFESSLPTRALHGDVSLRNLLRPSRRLVWNDFEDTFRGPVPLGCFQLAGSLRIHGASERSVREMLEASAGRMSRSWPPFSRRSRRL